MKVDFKNLIVEVNIEGDTMAVDIRHEIGNAIYQTTNDIGFADFAKEIYYSDGEVEVPDEYRDRILTVSKNFTVPVQKALINILKKD